MCVRTKTSYGCGHAFRDTVPCETFGCNDISRYHLAKEGDCKGCKSEAVSGTRGRDGMGRYAQMIKRTSRKKSTSSSDDTPHNSSSDDISPIHTAGTSPIEHDVSGGASPWLPKTPQEKNWASPCRKQADDAWMSEHDNRMSDLQERVSNCNITSRRKASPRPSHRLVDDSEHEENDTGSRRSETPAQPPFRYQFDISTHAKSNSSHRSRSDRSRRHQNSHDSLEDSMPSYSSGPHLKAYSSIQYGQPKSKHEYDFYTPGYGTTTGPHTQYAPRVKTSSYGQSVSRRTKGQDMVQVSPVVHESGYGRDRLKYQRGQHHHHQYEIAEPNINPYVSYRPRY